MTFERISGRVRQTACIVASTLGASIALVGCGGATQTAEPTREVKLTPPKQLVEDGALTFCSDIGYPPMEFEQDGVATGADIDIGRRLAKLAGLEAKFVNTPFDEILPELQDGACDAAISSITDNAERREQVLFADYLEVGQSLMVQTANPDGIENLDDLAGAKVAVQEGTVNEEFLRERAAGAENPPKIQAFAKDTDATAALKRGDVDAYFGDSPVVAYHIGQEALTYAFAGDPIAPEPIGIAVRSSDAKFRKELDRGIEAMYEDGSMGRILRRWKLDDFALER